MSNKYKKIFEPLTVKRMTIPNRIVMMPMGTNYAEQNGEMSWLHLNYYEQRAKGGTGLIIVENVCVDFPTGSNGTSQLRLDHDSFMPRLFKLCEVVHSYGSCISVQINHAGASAMQARTGVQPVSSSTNPSKTGGAAPRPLTKEEIYDIAKKYGDSARRAMQCGFDAVEIHAGHSYLISQFLSPIYNDRTDEFGGSVENRVRFLKLVVDEVRKAVGPFFPIMLRLSVDEFLEGGNKIEDCLEYLKYVADDIDIFDCSCALNDSLQYQIDANRFPDGWRSYMAKAVKDAFGKPVISMGNYRDPAIVEKVLESGDTDLIGMGRGLIAEPAWCNKVKAGKEDTLRKCISCNVGCAGNRIGFNRPIRCTVNPSTLVGDVYKDLKVNKPCNVVVIGGGTAGLEAACTAAEVGCTTFLIEKEEQLGGLSMVISKIPAKNRLADFPKYLINRAKNLSNLFIFNGQEATVDFVSKLNPDIIVNAVGSGPLLPPIKGLAGLVDKEGSKVQSIIGMINNINNYPEDMTGKKVVVIGGGAVGLDVVEHFAEKGAQIDIVEMAPIIGNGLDPITKVDTQTMMKTHNVVQRTNTALQEVKADAFTVKTPEGEIIDLPFDYGFVCLGMKANSPAVIADIKAKYEDTDVTILNIGDAARARRIIDGTLEGRNILITLANRGLINYRP